MNIIFATSSPNSLLNTFTTGKKGDIRKLTASKVRNVLKKAGIYHKNTATKPEVQAIWCLWALGYITNDNAENFNTTLLSGMAEICESPKKKLLTGLENSNLDTDGTRAKQNGLQTTNELAAAQAATVQGAVDRAVAAAQASDDEAAGEEANSTLDNESGTSFQLNSTKKRANDETEVSLPRKRVAHDKNSTDNTVVEKEVVEDVSASTKGTPSPSVLNLLLSFIFAAAARTSNKKLPGYRTTNRIPYLDRLNALPVLETTGQIKAIVNDTKVPGETYTLPFQWICKHHGDRLIEEINTYKIPCFGDAIQQFVVRKQEPELQAEFDELLANAKSQSIVLFYDTPLSHLYDILLNGFEPYRLTSGVVMNESPDVGHEEAVSPKQDKEEWNRSSFKNHRVVLGCEVVGAGEHIASGVHTITDPSSIAIRYVFMVPLEAKDDTATIPERENVASSMMAAFKKIRALTGERA